MSNLSSAIPLFYIWMKRVHINLLTWIVKKKWMQFNVWKKLNKINLTFTEEARSSDKGVLVHCLAGVSRSVTITVAYLMHKLSLSLNDAFNMVRSRKSNIAPNFHFMEQLHSFEKELKIKGVEELRKSERRCTGTCKSIETCNCSIPPTFLSPLDLGLSPDSGIEFDRWASSGTPAEWLDQQGETQYKF